MLRAERLTLSAGGRELMVDLELHLRPGERVGLVGRNGTGKTTLLRALAGEHALDAGQVHVRGRLGYLPQHPLVDSERSVWDEVRSGMTHVLALEAELAAASEALDGSEEAIEKHARVAERFEAAGGWRLDELVGTVLHGLGFAKSDWKRPVPELSGGWRVRVALARLLVEAPEVLLLDEPTNHLDLHARAWLAGHLAEHKGALILVSHDRFVLDRCIGAVVELRGGGLERYTGNFSRFVVAREERAEHRRATLEKQQEEAARLGRFVERFRYKASKAKQAQSRVKRLEKLSAQMEDLQEDQAPPRLAFTARESQSYQVLGLRGVAAGYEAPLFEGVELDLHRGHRWAFLGPNGCGKSTLLKVLAGSLAPLAGTRVLGKGVRVGVFEQDQARSLPPALRAVDHVLAQAPLCTELRARSALGALGLQGDQALQEIGTLSGGEKARVALAALSVRSWDVLLLDEPSNHLDVVTVGVLCEALKRFAGVVVLVSHDRYLVEQLATHVGRFSPQGFEMHEGLEAADLEPTRMPSPQSVERREEAAVDYAEQKRLQREADRNARRLVQVEALVDTLEGKLAALDEELGSAVGDPEAVRRILADREAVAAELEAAMVEWEGLAD